MRIESISLKNFGSFRDANIDLSGINASVICGQNGAGKSTGFVDAPLAALFGKCRTSLDDIMTLGSEDMVLTVTFQLNGQRYRVIRKRSKKTKAGKSELALQIANGDSWEDASGARIQDTQDKICRLLNADYELLTATGFLLQGQADKFSRATPSERKAILAQILRLDQYGPLKQAANRHLTIAEAKQGEKAAQLSSLEAEAGTLASLEARQAEVSGALAESQHAIEQLERHQQALTEKKATLAAEIEQLSAIPSQIAHLQTTQSTLQASHAALTTRRERASKILANRATIEAKCKEEEAAQSTGRQLDEERAQLGADLATAQQRVASEVEQLKTLQAQRDRLQIQALTIKEQLVPLIDRNLRASKILANRATIEAKVAEQASLMQAHALREEEAADCQTQLDAITIELEHVHRELLAGSELRKAVEQARRRTDELITAYDSHTKQLKDELERDDRQTKLLTTVPCDASLQQRCQFTLSAVQIKEALPEKRQRYANRWGNPDQILEREHPVELKALHEASRAYDEWVKLDWDGTKIRLETRRTEVMSKQAGIKAQIGSLKASLAEIAQFTVLAPELAAAEREVDQVEQDLAQRRQELDQAEQEFKDLLLRQEERQRGRVLLEDEVRALTSKQSICAERRQACQALLAELAKFTILVPELAAAEREVLQVDQDLDRMATDFRRGALEIEQLQCKQAAVATLKADHDNVLSSLAQDTIYLDRLRSDGQTAIGRLKELELEIKRAQEAARQAEHLRLECLQLQTDALHFQALVTAYSQIPVLILETAIPLLAEEANRILAKISTTGLRVTFDTQKTLKSRDGLAETLDIKVRDVFGERMLENFSGGERARVDLAVRIGLSKLLANRAGARLETLIVDEAFAAVDREGVEQLVECLPLLSQEFPLILFVTHDESFKSAIAQQIVVSKGPHGSQVVVVV
jgi:exonuclease SbcC